jgi:hypothetical protein
MIASRWILLRIRNVSDKSCRENQNTHFMFSHFFPKIVPLNEKMWKNMVERSDHRWQYGASSLHAGLLRLQTRSEYIIPRDFSKTMVTRKRLNVALDVHCLSCSGLSPCSTARMVIVKPNVKECGGTVAILFIFYEQNVTLTKCTIFPVLMPHRISRPKSK